ncbi:hypothetical protein GIB67_037111 [Kingdonia uniflora]|uniref:Uncharacterized protein n=1 Tax=Kingdonia uniflora TaxID=39325 RepID=A0A7J7LHT2_9MAGN|nr:hypothetical protein GIB67_037111 [Kingdonia uniflora]
MRPSSFLRAKFPVRLSHSTVTPWPVRSSFDEWLTQEIDGLQRWWKESYVSTHWLIDVVNLAVDTQKMTMDTLKDIVYDEGERKVIEDYLEEVVELLDACNRLRERVEIVQNYIDCLRGVLSCFEGRSTPMLARARVVLDSCEAMERRCSNLEKCCSSLRKLGDKISQGCVGIKLNPYESHLKEVLSGSKAVALLACGSLGFSLSFKSKRGFHVSQSHQTNSWSSSLHNLHKEVKEEVEKQRKFGRVVLIELREAVVAAQSLRALLGSTEPNWNAVEALSRKCEKLEEGIEPLGGGLNELYRHLISIRMVLLGILSNA